MMVDHQRVGVLDATDQIVFAVAVESFHVGQVAEDLSLGLKIVIDEVGDDDPVFVGHERNPSGLLEKQGSDLVVAKVAETFGIVAPSELVASFAATVIGQTSLCAGLLTPHRN
jgi:hypothetical protein